MSLIEVKTLKKYYPVGKKSVVKALDDVSFSVKKGATLGIVGESGCGKSTLAKQLMGLESTTSGEMLFSSKNTLELSDKERFKFIQMIFQDPYSSLNPRKKAWKLIADPLIINTKITKKEAYQEACKMMEIVGLSPALADRYPHMFSGGQRQRIGIARSLILKPEVIICDEPVSALDVSIQAQILNLLVKIQDELNLTYLFISHDLSVVRHIADQIIVMYLGKIVEYGDRDQIFHHPKHPYTKALLQSSPSLKGKSLDKPAITGELPSPLTPPSGCSFHQRCPIATDKCSQVVPELQKKSSGQSAACYMVE